MEWRRRRWLLAEVRVRPVRGRPGRGLRGDRTAKVAPGIYFRMLFVGYFGESTLNAALRGDVPLAIVSGAGADGAVSGPQFSDADSGSLSAIEVAEEVFAFVLKMACERKLISGTQVGVDATLLEANAAMKSIVRRDTDEFGSSTSGG